MSKTVEKKKKGKGEGVSFLAIFYKFPQEKKKEP